MYGSLFTTEFGQGRVLATEQGVCRVELPGAGVVFLGEECAPSLLTDQAAKMLQAYFSGAAQPLEILPVDLTEMTPFRSRILTLIRSIPHGEVRSYGEVARMAGLKGAARAIGGVMASNPIPVIIPCHRIVAADGCLTGYTAPGGLYMKKRLLEIEGVEFKGETKGAPDKVINIFSPVRKNLDTTFCKHRS